jgi:hypothetical protein
MNSLLWSLKLILRKEEVLVKNRKVEEAGLEVLLFASYHVKMTREKTKKKCFWTYLIF